jgi:hypothetical protein
LARFQLSSRKAWAYSDKLEGRRAEPEREVCLVKLPNNNHKRYNNLQWRQAYLVGQRHNPKELVFLERNSLSNSKQVVSVYLNSQFKPRQVVFLEGVLHFSSHNNKHNFLVSSNSPALHSFLTFPSRTLVFSNLTLLPVNSLLGTKADFKSLCHSFPLNNKTTNKSWLI